MCSFAELAQNISIPEYIIKYTNNMEYASPTAQDTEKNTTFCTLCSSKRNILHPPTFRGHSKATTTYHVYKC
jgi:hypothetical protein